MHQRTPLPPTVLRLSLLAMLALEVWISLQADRDFRRTGVSIRPGQRPPQLLTRGVFPYSRDPMYLGDAGLLAGVALLLGGLSSLLIWASFVVILPRRFILPEEARLAEVFAPQWQASCRCTPRWR